MLPQRHLVPQVLECTTGSIQMSDQGSQRSGAIQNPQPLNIYRQTSDSDHIKSDCSLVYTASNKKRTEEYQPLREINSRLNQSEIEEDRFQQYPEKKSQRYPTFNPSYGSLNLKGGNQEYDRENLELLKKIADFKKNLDIVVQGTDQEKCALVRDYFAARKNPLAQNQSLCDDRASLLCDITYDQDSSRNDTSMHMKRRTQSLHRKTGNNSVNTQQSDFYENISALLGVDGEENIYNRLKDIQKENQRFEKFLNSFRDMILKLTPKGAYSILFHIVDGRPNLQECWRWIKGILREYMHLKKGPVKLTRKKQQILDYLVQVLELEREDDIPLEINNLIQMIKEFHP